MGEKYYSFTWNLSWPESVPVERRREILRRVQEILGKRWPGSKFITAPDGESVRILIPASKVSISTEQFIRNYAEKIPAGRARLN